MGLRPARTCRDVRGQPWARISNKKPRKSFVKGAPRPKVRQYNMGVDRPYELEVELIAEWPVRVRDNAIEAARQAANKHLEKMLFDIYFFQIAKYPHLVLREHAALGVAGADRISKGMKLAFGRPKGRMVQVNKGGVIFRARVLAKDLPVLKEAFGRAKLKMPGKYDIRIRDISKDAVNLARKGHAFKKEEKPKEETPVVAAAAEGAAAPAEGAKVEEKKEEKKK